MSDGDSPWITRFLSSSSKDSTNSPNSGFFHSIFWKHRVTACKAEDDYKLWIRFDDGLEGEIDLGPDLVGRLRGPVFEPLRDPTYFAQFTVDWTLTWPNGADLAPESLYARVLKARRAS